VQDFAEVTAKPTNGHGVDVGIDFVGAPYFARNIASLASGGWLVQVGILGGGSVGLALEHLKSRPQTEKHEMMRRFREHWLDRFEGRPSLEPVVDSTFTLA
jgi:NADPH2:quinone reductase